MKIIKNKVFKFIVFLYLIGLILGLITYFKLKNIANNNLINEFYYNTVSFNYFYQSFLYNFKYLFIIWCLGYVFFLSILLPFVIILRGIITSYLFASIISIYGLKGFLVCLVFTIPLLINEIIYILTAFYGINFSNKCIKCFKYNKSINYKYFIKNYILILVIFSLIILISSLFEIYISSFLMKIVV